MGEYSVYMHTTPNDKRYVGITCQNPKIRWGNGSNYKNQPYFSNAINKFGWNNIKHEILYTALTKDEAEQKERELIAFYNSADRRYGYNIDLGGKSKGRCSEETKKKISKVQRGRKQRPETIQKRIASRKGYHHSIITKQKISNANKGHKISDRQKEFLRMINTGRKHTQEEIEKQRKSIKASWTPERRKLASDRQKGSNCNFYGKKWSTEEIKHLQDINRGEKSVLSKKVGQFDLQGNLICTFGSAREAGRAGFTASGITGVCRGEKHTHKGFIWKYMEA